MSKSVSSVEIEDVLSSIRRLVSNTGGQDGDEPSKPERATDKLVLTPSLRVDGGVRQTPKNAENTPENSVHQKDEPEISESDDSSDTALSEEFVEPLTMAEPDASLVDVATESQPGGAADDHAQPAVVEEEDGSRREGDRESNENAAQNSDDVPDETEVANDRDRLETGGGDGAVVDDPHDENQVRDELSARVASFETVLAERDEGWEPDGSTDDENAGSEVEPLRWQEDQEAQGEDAPETGVEDVDQDETAILGFQSNRGVTLDKMDQDIQAEISPEVARQALLGAQGELSAEDDLLDRDALRDLVNEIVRQELQGALGERITRNVRKLVRREIHRVLASQELE